jgi:HK97 family phage major capsid protein
MASEGGAITDSRLDFSRLTPTAKKAVSIIGANSEILRSRTLPDGFEQVVRRSLVKQMASKVDQQGLAGTGANGQVSGLKAKTLDNVTLSSSPVTGFITANGLISMVANVAADNALMGKLCWIMHPSAWAAIYKLRDTAGQPLITPFNGVGQPTPGGLLYGYPVYMTPQVVSTATVYFGNVADMTLWDWGIYIDISTEAGFLSDQVYIRGLQHFDWTLGHAESFVSGHNLNVS